jgi:hypothetical protein
MMSAARAHCHCLKISGSMSPIRRGFKHSVSPQSDENMARDDWRRCVRLQRRPRFAAMR